MSNLTALSVVTRIALLWAAVATVSVPPVSADGSFAGGLPVINKAISQTQAMDLAALNNPGVAEAAGGKEAARGDADLAASDLRPSVSGTTFATAGSTSNIFSTSPGVQPQDFLTVPSNGFGDQNVVLMVPLYSGGLLLNKHRAAYESASVASSQVDAVRRTMERDAAVAYDGALQDAALVAAAQSRLTAEDEQVRVIQQEVDAGRLAPVDLLREQAEQADADQSLASATNQAVLSIIDLKLTIGADLTSQLTQSDTLDGLYSTLPALPDSLESALQDALAHRPEIAAAQHAVASAEASSHAADSFDAPQIYGVAMGDVAAQSRGGSSAGYSAGVTLSLPLDDGGRRNAEVEGAQGRLSQTKARQTQTVQQVERDVTAAWLAGQLSEQAHAAAVTGLAAASQSYDLAQMRYNLGKSTTAVRLDSLSTLTRARANLADAAATVLDSRVQLLWATGRLH